MSRTYFTFAGIASLALLPSLSLAAPGSFTDSITISEDIEVFTQLILEGNGATNNWVVGSNTVSAAGFGSFGEFSISDDGGNIAMIIFPGASNALTIAATSRVEIGTEPFTFHNATGNPLTLVDSISGNNAPNIHFRTTAGAWGIGGNENGFSIVDGNDGNFGIAFSVEKGAPTWALHIDPAGQVGLGTPVPDTTLHVQSTINDFVRPLLVENTSGIGFSGFRLKIASDSWIDFNNSDGNFRINSDQSPGSEFEVRPNGDAFVKGILTQGSDVNTKQDIEAIDRQQLLQKVMSLAITEWSYIHNPSSRHIGPMAQDFYQSFGLGSTDKGITSIDTGGVALAAIQAVKQEKDSQLADKERQMNRLRGELQQLKVLQVSQEERMIQLEMALAEVLRDRSAEVKVGLAD